MPKFCLHKTMFNDDNNNAVTVNRAGKRNEKHTSNKSETVSSGLGENALLIYTNWMKTKRKKCSLNLQTKPMITQDYKHEKYQLAS